MRTDNTVWFKSQPLEHVKCLSNKKSWVLTITSYNGHSQYVTVAYPPCMLVETMSGLAFKFDHIVLSMRISYQNV